MRAAIQHADAALRLNAERDLRGGDMWIHSVDGTVKRSGLGAASSSATTIRPSPSPIQSRSGSRAASAAALAAGGGPPSLTYSSSSAPPTRGRGDGDGENGDGRDHHVDLGALTWGLQSLQRLDDGFRGPPPLAAAPHSRGGISGVGSPTAAPASASPDAVVRAAAARTLHIASAHELPAGPVARVRFARLRGARLGVGGAAARIAFEVRSSDDVAHKDCLP